MNNHAVRGHIFEAIAGDTFIHGISVRTFYPAGRTVKQYHQAIRKNREYHDMGYEDGRGLGHRGNHGFDSDLKGDQRWTN